MDNEKLKTEGGEMGDWGELVEFGKRRFGGEVEKSSERVERHNRWIPVDRRQQRKIAAVLLTGDIRQIERREIDEEIDEGEVLRRIRQGEIGQKEYRQVVDNIMGPMDRRGGVEEVAEGLRTKHERRILAEMSERGFENWEGAGASELYQFRERFPSPVDFEEESEKFLEKILKSNTEEKYKEYKRAMSDFKMKVYGKKQEYFDQIKIMEDIAKAGASIGPRKERMTEQRRVEEMAEKKEKLIVSEVASCNISRLGLMSGRGELEMNGEARESEDSMVVNKERGLFGVFDGAGGIKGGRLASQIAKRAAAGFLISGAKRAEDLALTLDQVSYEIEKTDEAGVTTGVLTQVVEREGRKVLYYASVGDSRIYVVGTEVRQLTRDEGFENKITNALGKLEGKSSWGRTKQYGEYELKEGERVVLCSDGITGDFEKDRMSDRELGEIVREAETTEQAATRLAERAKKIDDRTAVVFEV